MQKFKGQQHRWGISGWVGVENPQNKQKHEYFTCIGQILHTSSTPEDCSHMTPLYSEPPQHWCSHSRKCCAGFLSSRPGFLVWPPRFAPSLCWRGEFFSLSGISLQLKLQVVKTFYFAQSFSFYRPAPQILGGGKLETDCTITENGERPHLTVQLKFWIFSRWKVTETRGCIFTTLTL